MVRLSAEQLAKRKRIDAERVLARYGVTFNEYDQSFYLSRQHKTLRYGTDERGQWMDIIDDDGSIVRERTNEGSR